MIEKTLQDTKGLVRVAYGEQYPDCIITNTRILNIFDGTIFEGNIWIYRNWIAYVGEKEPIKDERTTFIDGEGYVAIPGYIDAHGHADLFYNPATFGDMVITTGTTTVFSDGHDMINSIGVEGFIEVLKTSDTFSVKFLWGVPATYPPYPDVEGGEMFSFYDVWRLFSRYRECVSMSELSPYMRILKNEDEILERVLMARSLGKNVEGHTLGASYDRLNVLVAAGITSCHESIRESDLRNRIRLGLATMVRHSSIRSDLKELCPVIKTLPKDSVMLVSDGIFAADLCTKGYMDCVVKAAIGFGLKPEDAIRMATLNPARYFRMDNDIGSITPGRIADILLLEDLEHPTPVKVIERGRLAADHGMLTRKEVSFPDIGTRFNPYVFDRVGKEEFLIEKKGEGTVPVIDIVDRTVTKKIDYRLPDDGTYLLSDRSGDVRKIVCTRRDTKKWGKGFVRGIGASVGAIASTVCHETHGLLVTGFDDDDMELAANTALSMGGGVVFVDGRKVLYTLSLPYGATMSGLPIKELAEELRQAGSILQKKGSSLDDPLWTIVFLTFTSIVEVRLTVSGVYDVKKAAIIF
ncbi:MAG: hypothetical protein C0399_03550 [Syntrophus sp. (in: bacteria)]|nr:hypothetical protein [Syntrophus sp. (in: bacteria)]